VAFILIFAWTACGGGGQSSHSTTPPPTQTAPPPPNTYSVVVSGTANGTIHNATVIVVLQ
jgi:hypothetical protein